MFGVYPNALIDWIFCCCFEKFGMHSNRFKDHFQWFAVCEEREEPSQARGYACIDFISWSLGGSGADWPCAAGPRSDVFKA